MWLQAFPWGPFEVMDSDQHDPGSKIAHLLALASRLAYQDAAWIQHVVEDLWGCTLVATRSCLPAHQHEARDYATSW